MTREIKFRMYETVAKKMFSHEDLVKHDLWSGLFEVQRDWQKYMQYTGLKDKQGKEIYEGDVVSIDNSPVAVEWYNGAWTVEYFTLPKRSYLSQFDETDVEIVGNIYENPELLK